MEEFSSFRIRGIEIAEKRENVGKVILTLELSDFQANLGVFFLKQEISVVVCCNNFS